MADEVKVELIGFHDLEKSLKGLDFRQRKNTLLRILTRGSAIIRNDMKSRVPVSTSKHYVYPRANGQRKGKGQSKPSFEYNPGTLKKTIKTISTRAGRRSADVFKLVGVKADKGGRYVANDAFYALFIEFGTVNMRPQPFIRPAFDANKDKVNKLHSDLIAKEIQKEWDKKR